MYIGINGWYYSMPYTGIGQCTVNLVCELSALSIGKHKITVFICSKNDVTTLPLLPNVEYYVIDKINRSNDIINIFEFEYLLRKATLKLKIDILHTPYLCSPLLHENSFKHIVTVHDVIPSIFTKYRGSYLRHIYFRYAESNINRADLIITVSLHSQMDIHKYLGLDNERVKVVYNGVDTNFGNDIDDARLLRVIDQYSLPDEYIFYIGGFDFRKNVRTLLEAYAKARKKGISELLVLGGEFNPSEKQLRRGLVENVSEIASDLNIQDCIRILGPIPQDDLPYIYKMARLFVYPSLYEGFGLPPLEAMNCGTPVLASNCSSIPEIIDRDDLLFDPDDPSQLSEKIQWLLTNDELRHSVGEWGIKKAKTFSWSRAAEETLDLYKMACRDRM
jgi:glycosyltransferase involved in cell wall biosynthesis